MAKRRKSSNGIKIKTERDIAEMRVACETASTILQTVAKEIQPGRTTKEIDLYSA